MFHKPETMQFCVAVVACVTLWRTLQFSLRRARLA